MNLTSFPAFPPRATLAHYVDLTQLATKPAGLDIHLLPITDTDTEGVHTDFGFVSWERLTTALALSLQEAEIHKAWREARKDLIAWVRQFPRESELKEWELLKFQRSTWPASVWADDKARRIKEAIRTGTRPLLLEVDPPSRDAIRLVIAFAIRRPEAFVRYTFLDHSGLSEIGCRDHRHVIRVSARDPGHRWRGASASDRHLQKFWFHIDTVTRDLLQPLWERFDYPHRATEEGADLNQIIIWRLPDDDPEAAERNIEPGWMKHNFPHDLEGVERPLVEKFVTVPVGKAEIERAFGFLLPLAPSTTYAKVRRDLITWIYVRELPQDDHLIRVLTSVMLGNMSPKPAGHNDRRNVGGPTVRSLRGAKKPTTKGVEDPAHPLD